LRLRGGKTGFASKEIFIEQIERFNPGFMNRGLAEDIIKRLERVPPNIEGNLTVWKYLKGLGTVYIPEEKRERNAKCNGSGHPFTTPCSYPSHHNPVKNVVHPLLSSRHHLFRRDRFMTFHHSG